MLVLHCALAACAGRDVSGGGVIVEIVAQDSGGIAVLVLVLPVPHRPQKETQSETAKCQRDRDQKHQNIHDRSRIAFSVTVIEDRDIAKAARSGVASPTKASGTAITL